MKFNDGFAIFSNHRNQLITNAISPQIRCNICDRKTKHYTAVQQRRKYVAKLELIVRQNGLLQYLR